MYDEKPKRKKVADYQQLHLRCPRCGRINAVTDMACRYCGSDLFKADVIRGTDYDRFDPNDLRKSCLLAIVPGLGLLREKKLFSGFLMLLASGFLLAWSLFGWLHYELAILPFVMLAAFSIASVFVTFIVALDRMGMQRPDKQGQLILLGRLVAGYTLIAFALMFCWLLPFSVVAIYLAWRILQPFFGKAMD
ncbi:MAG: hypothetical protein RMK89_00855 [Armatimonadota bacterium]|nr:zinc ribbon domain-containing protein [Armatimonadota bacterium]MDW8141986.1 hypothetical protein [Armatimonadota bacterium]